MRERTCGGKRRRKERPPEAVVVCRGPFQESGRVCSKRRSSRASLRSSLFPFSSRLSPLVIPALPPRSVALFPLCGGCLCRATSASALPVPSSRAPFCFSPPVYILFLRRREDRDSARKNLRDRFFFLSFHPGKMGGWVVGRGVRVFKGINLEIALLWGSIFNYASTAGEEFLFFIY